MRTEPDGTPLLRVRKNDLVWQAIDDDTILLDLRSSRYLRLNAAGTLLWDMLTTGADHAALVTELSVRYGLDPARAAADVDIFLQRLRSHQLLA